MRVRTLAPRAPIRRSRDFSLLDIRLRAVYVRHLDLDGESFAPDVNAGFHPACDVRAIASVEPLNGSAQFVPHVAFSLAGYVGAHDFFHESHDSGFVFEDDRRHHDAVTAHAIAVSFRVRALRLLSE